MNRFKELRESRNISLEKLSSILKTNTSTLSRIENGQREPKQSTIEDYANFFNVSIDYLLGFSDNPNINNDKNILTESEQSMLNDYRLLNVNGKKEAEKRVKELTSMSFYREDETVTIAAHSNKPIDDEEMERIMEDLKEMQNW